MLIKDFVLTPFRQNTRIVACEESLQAICIDPGEACPDVEEFLKDKDLHLQAIALTHGHLDHIGGASFLSSRFPHAEIILHKDDEDLYYALPKQPLFFGIQPQDLESLGLAYDNPPRITQNWSEGEIYAVGKLNFSVRHCPGHTTGHVILAEERQGKVFVGDCLFKGSIGRTDLPGGSYDELIHSIEKNILSLDDDVIVYSGHGEETTVGTERNSNPFLNSTDGARRGRYL